MIVRTATYACGLALVLLAGCSGSRAAPTSEPIRFRATPPWIREACGSFPASFRSFCPSAVPAGPRALTLSMVLATPRYPVNLLQLEAGGEFFGDQRRNRPPRYVGIFLANGEVKRALAELFPSAGAPVVGVRDGLTRGRRPKAVALGVRRWAGFDGDLFLAPSEGRIPLVYFNYLLVHWRDGSGEHLIGLHEWEPFHETVQILHALVDRLKAAPAEPLAYRGTKTAGDVVATTLLPRWALLACRSLRTRPICPNRIPAANASFIDVFYEPGWRSGPPSKQEDLLSLSWGAPYENQPTKDRPPRFLHLELAAGAVPVDRHFQHPVVQVHDGLMRGRGYEAAPPPLPLGERDWNGRRGALVLGDCFGNHVCFRWRDRGVGYQIDLHGWEPFTQTVAVLRAVVDSLPRR